MHIKLKYAKVPSCKSLILLLTVILTQTFPFYILKKLIIFYGHIVIFCK